MNILYHHRTKSRDGQAVHIRELIQALRNRGHHVHEWALSPVFTEEQSGEMGSEGNLLGRVLGHLPRAAYELGEHAYGPSIARKLVETGREMGADVLYERHALNNTAGIRAAAKLDIPLLLEVNSPLTHERSAHETLVFQKWSSRSEVRVLKSATRVLVVTSVLADMLAERGVDRDRIEVIPNGVDLSLYPDPGNDTGPGVTVGFTGFFRPWHRVDLMVQALADGVLGDDTRVLLVGDGPAREDIVADAKRLGVAERVEITGSVPRDDIPAYLARMDVCVQPAATAWASPLKLFEYMAAGKAIIAPDQSNLREILTEGRDALLFPPDDGAAMMSALAKLCGDATLRTSLGAGARATIEDSQLTWAHNAERVERIAAECLTGATP